MNLPFELASWLSLNDAATRLSESFGKTITVDGLIQLAIDDKIPLSWNVTSEYACQVTQYCSFSPEAEVHYGLTEAYDPDAERIEYEGNIYWVDNWAYRKKRNSERQETWGYLDWFPDYTDSPPVSVVSGLFSFDLEIRGARSWTRNLLERERPSWPGNEMCLLDHGGHIWSFLRTNNDGRSWEIMHEGPPREEIVIQRIDIEAFESQMIEQKPQQNNGAAVKSSIAPPNGPWPWGTYETPMLGHLKTAAEKWWVRFDPTDPTTAPTNSQVIEWLNGA